MGYFDSFAPSEKKEDTPDEEKEVNEHGFLEKRSCTDVFCLVAFLVTLVFFVIVTIMGFQDGNPSKLFAPRDYQGGYCGVKENWNAGPDLENQVKRSYMMNVSKTTDVIAKQFMCSSAAKDYLLSSSAGLTTAEQQAYLCECCLVPCDSCDASLNVGGDITGDLLSGNPFGVVQSRMASITSQNDVSNLFSPSGVNGDFFTTIWNQANEYFVKVCLPSCQPDISNTSYRPYLYKPSPDEGLSLAWAKLMAAPTASAFNSSFIFRALPFSQCPYDPSVCVPFPGVAFGELPNNYCSFEMTTAVKDAVGSAAASIFETAGVDSFVDSTTETVGMWVGDVERSLDVFALVCLSSFIIGLVYLTLMRFTVTFCVWFAVFVIFLGFGFGGLFAFVRSHQCKDAGFFNTAKQTTVAVAIASSSAVSNAISGNDIDESLTGNGADYRGVQTRTRSGTLCQQWDTDSPHNVTGLVSSAIYPNAGLTTNGQATNYCRNPHNVNDTNIGRTIWCYTTDSTKRWELCMPIGTIRPDCNHGYAVPNDTARKVLEICAYVIWALAGVWVLMVVCLVKRIRLAIALNQVAAEFVAQAPYVVVVPIVQAIVGCIWVLIWCLCASFLLSQVPDGYTPKGAYASYAEAYGTYDTPGACTDKWPTGMVWKDAPDNCEITVNATKCWRCAPPRYMFDWRFAVSFFTFLWNNAFLIALGQCIIAGAVGVWFFKKNDEKGKLGGGIAILRQANWIVWRYHLGSLAFGAFILALVQFIRYLMKYFEMQAQAQKNRVMVIVLKVVQCCLYCFERFIKFLNKNAYVQVAIRGTNFCTSAWKAFQIILANAVRFGVVAVLGYVIHMIGYIFIMAATLVIGYMLLGAMHPDISPVLPMLVYAFVSYVVGKLYMNVFGMAVDTCLQCFIFAEEKGANQECIPPKLFKLLDQAKAGKDPEE